MTLTESTHSTDTDWLTGLRVLDADTHFTEPPNLWTSRAPQRLRDRVPHIVVVDGSPHWVVDGVDQGFASGYGTVKADGSKASSSEFFALTVDDVSPAAHDPAARLAMLDEIDIYAQIIYPNMAGFGGEAFASVTDPELKRVCAEIYNDAMAEMQDGSGGRLLPMSLVPWWDIDASVAEVKRTALMGSRGVVMCTDPHVRGIPDLAHPDWNPFWEACIEAQMPVNFHIGASSGGVSSFLSNPWPSLSTAAAMTVTSPILFLNNSKIILNMTMGGVLERYPDLRIVSVESGTGWVPFVMEAIDHQHNEEVASGNRILKKDPSEYIRNQVHTCFFFEKIRPELFQTMNENNVMFETDFPHPVCLYPDYQDLVTRNLTDIPLPVRRKLMQDNAANLYRIDLPTE
jgi:uncharacterized protein